MRWTLAFSALVAVGCRPDVVKHVSPKEAHRDGFEVVVLEGPEAKARSLLLQDAERALAEHPTMTTSLPEARVDALEEELGAAARGDGGEGTTRSSVYPLLGVKVKPKPGNRQEVYLSYHFSIRTFYYQYETDGRHVMPLWSGVRDLGGDRRVVYDGPSSEK